MSTATKIVLGTLVVALLVGAALTVNVALGT